VFKKPISKISVLVSSFVSMALDSRASKEIDFYCNYMENKLQMLAFTAVTVVYVYIL